MEYYKLMLHSVSTLIWTIATGLALIDRVAQWEEDLPSHAKYTRQTHQFLPHQ